MRRLGYAAGLSVFFETSAFGALTQMAGWLGPVALASYSIAHNIEATVFMVALGLSVATGVRVGIASGARTPREARFAGFTGLGAAVAVMALIGSVLVAFGPQVAGFYTADATVAAATAGLMAVVAVTAIPDGGQIVMGQCNRAMGDSFVSTALYFVAYWGVMIPLGWFLAFGAGMGAAGLLWATAAGCALSLLLQALRFVTLTARSLRAAA
jgi:MATE family multidrug resistance protein